MKKHETATMLAMLTEVWATAPVSDEALDIWHMAIGHLDRDVAQRVFMQLVQTQEFMPKPATVLKMAADTMGRSPLPDEAWAEIMGRIKKRGRYVGGPWGEAEPFTHPAIEKAMQAIRYDEVCDCPIDKLSILRAQFTKIYESHVERDKRDGATAIQPGAKEIGR